MITTCLTAGAFSCAAVAQTKTLPIIEDIAWPRIHAYCTFRRAGWEFDYNDPETWRFVYFTNHASRAVRGAHDFEIDAETAFVNLRHQLRQLELLNEVVTDEHLHRTYRSYGEPPHRVVLDISKTAEGYEHADYRGTLSVSGPFGEEVIDVRGDCGV